MSEAPERFVIVSISMPDGRFIHCLNVKCPPEFRSEYHLAASIREVVEDNYSATDYLGNQSKQEKPHG